MTHIESLNSTPYVNPTQAGGKSAAVSSADFQTFLSMLTAQIKNQDPLSPMEGTEFASQLATFSAVEQQTLTNVKLQELIDHAAGDKLLGYGNWIGKLVQTTAPIFNSGQNIQILTSNNPAAEKEYLVVRDQYGRDLNRIMLDKGTESISWNNSSISSTGGIYSFHVESYAGDVPISSRPASTLTTVEGVELQEGEVRLALAGGTFARSDEISALRR